jgi:hypothetical protein
MYNNIYRSFYDKYEHYKTKFNYGNVFTGGSFQSFYEMGALFSTPLQPAVGCDNYDESLKPEVEYFFCHTIGLSTPPYLQPTYVSSIFQEYTLPFEKECKPFREGESPEFSMQPPENETDIINFYDRITVKDTPSDTKYQIYSMTGQLIQTGTTNPDISTNQLSKGMYILRLENGKAVKFIKQ